jgi:hypothetical protein
MTHIRIRASLGGNIPRMSKILPVPRDTFVFQTVTIATSKFRAESFISPLQAELDPAGGCFRNLKARARGKPPAGTGGWKLFTAISRG